MNTDPTRLQEDANLDSILRRDLQMARKHPPDHYDVQAGLGILVQRLDTPPGGTPPASPGTGGGGLLGGLQSGWVATATALATIGAAVTLGWIVHTDSPAVAPAMPPPPLPAVAAEPVRESPPTADAAKLAPDATPGIVPKSRAARSEPAPPSASPRQELRRRARARKASPRRTTAAKRTPARETARAATEGAAGNSMRAEIEHLAKLRSVWRQNPARGLRMARKGNQRFGNGMFGEEREAISIFALRALGRDEAARREARAFLRAHPLSPFAEDLTRWLQGTSPQSPP